MLMTVLVIGEQADPGLQGADPGKGYVVISVDIWNLCKTLSP